jgi:acetoacetate decarboxylase
MTEEEIRKHAFAMPLTNPAFPPGPYRFVQREYLIITYRTDPDRLRRGSQRPPGRANKRKAA